MTATGRSSAALVLLPRMPQLKWQQGSIDCLQVAWMSAQHCQSAGHHSIGNNVSILGFLAGLSRF